jgi:hypothetical protein
MNVFKTAQDTRTPAGEANENSGERTDTPEHGIAHARVANRTAHSAVHRQMDGKDNSQKYGEEIKRDFHVVLRATLGAGDSLPTSKLRS